MLQAINDRIKGWLGAVVVGLIALPFAFWGIQEYTGGSKEPFAAKINNVEISEQELDYNLAQQRQKLMAQFGGELPFDDVFLKKQVLEQLVSRKLVESSTYNSGYRVSDAELSSTIMRVFSNDGKFDRDMFERTLQSRGQSIPQFEYELRNDIRVTQMSAALTSTAFVTDDEIRRLAMLEEQSREASLLKFAVNDYQADITVSEEDIQKTWESQSERYMLPEKVSVEYVELKNEKLAADVEIDEQQLEQMYNDYVAEVSQKERRKASHILLKADADKEAARKKLEDIRQQLSAGAAFDKLAKEHSQDPGSARQGGDLGWVGPGQMVKPFEDALFDLQRGEVSDVVESEFGFHLIKLEGVESEAAVPFKEKRAELEQILKQDAVGNLFYDLSETMATTAYENPDSLNSVIEVMGIASQTSKLFTRETGEDIAANEKVRNAAFSKSVLQDGTNSEIIELAPNHVVVLRVREHKPASLRPLEEVRSAIENTLRVQKAHQLALQAAQAAKVRVESGESLMNIAGSGQVLEKTGVLKRSDSGKVDQQVLDVVFKLPRPEEGRPAVSEVSMYNGDVMLVVLGKVLTPENIEQSSIDSFKNQYMRDTASQDLNAALLSLRTTADIRLNQRLFEK